MQSALIVDKSNSSRKTLVSVIRTGLGIKTINAFENTQRASHFLKDTKEVDLIFIDYDTANGETFDFVSSSKELTGNKDTKYILLSNSANKDFLLEAAKKGISSFILKPYNSKTVVEKVRKVCASKKQRRSSRLSLLEAVDLDLIINGNKLPGALVDISSGGCLLKTSLLGAFGIDIYDCIKIRIPFGSESVTLDGELIRVERDTTTDEKGISAGFIFKNMNQETVMQFAKLWSSLLKDNPGK